MNADLAMQHALDRYHRVGVSGLTEDERTLAALWCFEADVANGGFEYFFKSRNGDLAAYAPAAFRRIGVEPLARIAERANALFGSGGVPADRARRAARLAELSHDERQLFDRLESEYDAFGTDIGDNIEAYLQRVATAGHADATHAKKS